MAMVSALQESEQPLDGNRYRKIKPFAVTCWLTRSFITLDKFMHAIWHPSLLFETG